MAAITIGDSFEYVWYQPDFTFPTLDTSEIDLVTITPETKYHFTTIQITSGDFTLDFYLRLYIFYEGRWHQKHTYATGDASDGLVTISPSVNTTGIFTLNDIISLPIKVTGQSTGLGEPSGVQIHINYVIGR